MINAIVWYYKIYAIMCVTQVFESQVLVSLLHMDYMSIIMQIIKCSFITYFKVSFKLLKNILMVYKF